tara:strand:- start:971 stop:1669 length:699 start_codon:yes stop_codon:yes gene_type:complete
VLLDVRDIHTFYGLSHVLHGVSLSVAEGRVVALVGRNGAGKTTTLRSIVGLTPPAEGSVVFEGETISGRKAYRNARSGIAYVPETRDVFSLLTVEENLRIAEDAASPWDVERVMRWFPALADLRDRKGSQLSGGQQQMMVIGRALVTGPRLLLLDEPSQGLAPVIVNDVLAMLKDLKTEGLSVLLVEQNIRMALELADDVYVMEHGAIVHHAAPDALAKDPAVLERYLGVAA